MAERKGRIKGEKGEMSGNCDRKEKEEKKEG